MTVLAPISLDNFRVDLVDVHLVHARYLDTESPSVQPRAITDEVPVGLQMAFDRPAVDRMTIALTVRVEIERPYRIEVTYAGQFIMDDTVSEDEREEVWRRAAAQVAPIVLYPYIRELVSSLTNRGRAEPFVLPVLSFVGLRNEDLQVPPPPHEQQLGLGVEEREHTE